VLQASDPSSPGVAASRPTTVLGCFSAGRREHMGENARTLHDGTWYCTSYSPFVTVARRIHRLVVCDRNQIWHADLNVSARDGGVGVQHTAGKGNSAGLPPVRSNTTSRANQVYVHGALREGISCRPRHQPALL
jgi:hypothetical protein